MDSLSGSERESRLRAGACARRADADPCRTVTHLAAHLLAVLCTSIAAAQDAPPSASWSPAAAPLMTRWAKDVSPERAWPEYPRPTMVRARWQNLNGLWGFAVTKAGAAAPAKDDGSILVPFPIESALSGVGRRVAPDEELWYRRTFRVPDDWAGQRVLLHFGAVDWRARVRVNDRDLGEHQGGYDAFSFDVTDALVAGDNALVVAVTDPTDAGGQPRGKQVRKPSGIWYTPTTGVWQTVWLEPVPVVHIQALHVTATARGAVVVRIEHDGPPKTAVRVEALDAGDATVSHAITDSGKDVALAIGKPRPWSPSDPFLYGLRVQLRSADGEVLDSVTGYFGCRTIEVGPDAEGTPRLLLNGAPLFQFGPLDQGFWPDGLYTAPTLDAMRFDIEAVRKMGGNMLRKHVKVEPELFYAECDRVGMLVWQDMPSANNPTAEWKASFETELAELVRERGNHPSIVMWVPFNEGWGQYDTERITAQVRALDPTRLVDNPSGWTDKGVGDVLDIHAYPGPAVGRIEKVRANVLGEFGGLGLPLPGHTWLAKDNWGYRSFTTRDECERAYLELLARLPLLIGQGLSAAVYTQTTDVEIEVNGWLTYDRAVWKIDPARAATAAHALYLPPPKVHVALADARQGPPATWRYTLTTPAEGWTAPDFDDHAWPAGPAGFGTAGTPGAVVGTQWNTNDLWVRRDFQLRAGVRDDLHLSIHHDEDVEVYLNGVLAAKLNGYTTSYVIEPIAAAARAALQPGRNVLAMHCRQTGGGQYLDAGLVEVRR